MWTFYAKVRTKQGFSTKKPARLWASKEAAENDVELFIWYESIRGPDDPKVPYPRGQWFKTMLPDESWDIVRDHLSDHGQKTHLTRKRKCDPNFVPSKFARRETNSKKECNKCEVDGNIQSPVKDLLQKSMVMRKRYSDLTVRRKVVVNKHMENAIRSYWSEVGRRQSDKELNECIKSIFPSIDNSSDDMRRSIKDSYTFADKKNNESHKTQIISTFALQKDMTKQKLELIIGHEISARKYSHARFHAVKCGPGQPLLSHVHSRNVDRRRIIVERFVSFCMENGIVTANGRSVSLPGIETRSVPNIKRVEGRQPLIRSFEERERSLCDIDDAHDAKSRCFVSLRWQSMEDVIAVVCPEKHCSLAALDVVGQLHGTVNFRVLRKKLIQLQYYFRHLKDRIDRLVRKLFSVEDTLSNKSKFRSIDHFCSERNSNGPAIHCHYYAFGKADPVADEGDGARYSCGHYHTGSCEICEEIESFGSTLDNLSEGESEDVKKMISNLNIDYHSRRFRHYAGHQARLAHESEALAHIKNKIKDDLGTIFITADYAMKYLPLKDSEAQNEFFGKAGINWHGLGFLWYCGEDMLYKHYFVNQCVEDSTEDGISVAALLSQV